MRGVTMLLFYVKMSNSISTHTPHARRDVLIFGNCPILSIFQLTRLMRGVTFQIFFFSTEKPKFQLTRLMRGVTWLLILVAVLVVISTHTPHARRDRFLKYACMQGSISTHTPHARRDTPSLHSNLLLI